MLRNLIAAVVLVVGCAGPELEDELADERHGSDAFTYYEIRPDLRYCPSPDCGGYVVSRVNRAWTRCADGWWRAACHVPALDTTALGLSEAARAALLDRVADDDGAVVRGWIDADGLVVEEAWIAGAAAGAPEGVGVKVQQTAIDCVQAPCEDKAEHRLNSLRSAMIADLDFAPSGATDQEIARAWEALFGDGLIVFGDRYLVGDGTIARARTVTQFYTRLAPISPEECEALGGIVRVDVGDGQVACAPGEYELARVAIGIEGGVCCAVDGSLRGAEVDARHAGHAGAGR